MDKKQESLVKKIHEVFDEAHNVWQHLNNLKGTNVRLGIKSIVFKTTLLGNQEFESVEVEISPPLIEDGAIMFTRDFAEGFFSAFFCSMFSDTDIKLTIGGTSWISSMTLIGAK